MPTAIPDWAQETEATVPDWAKEDSAPKETPGIDTVNVDTFQNIPHSGLERAARDFQLAGPQTDSPGVVQTHTPKTFSEQLGQSFLDEVLPQSKVNPEDSKSVAVGKEVYNLAAGIPKFATSPGGVASALASTVSAPAVTAVFMADMLKNIGQTAYKTYENWDKMSAGEKAAAVTDMVGTGAFGTLLGAHLKSAVAPNLKLEFKLPSGTKVADRLQTESFRDAIAKRQPATAPITQGEPNAVQVEESNKGVLVTEQPAVGLPEVVRRDAESQAPAKPEEKGKEEIVDQPENKTHVGNVQSLLDELRVASERFKSSIDEGNPDWEGYKKTIEDAKSKFKSKSSSQADYNVRVEQSSGGQAGKPSESLYVNVEVTDPKTGEDIIPSFDGYRISSHAAGKDYGGGKPLPEIYTKPAEVRKFRVGKSPQTWTVVEKIPQSTIEKESGEQPIRVKNEKTGEVQTMMEGDLTPVTERSAEQKKASKKENLDAQLKAAGMEPSSFPNNASKRAALKRSMALSEGPGAASPGDIPQESQLSQLTKTIDTKIPKDKPLTGQLSAIDRLKESYANAKEAVTGSLARMGAQAKAMWDVYRGRPAIGDVDRAEGEWDYSHQRADWEARKFAQRIQKAVPNDLDQEGIVNWIQADGDEAMLRDRAEASKGDLKRGYEQALKLTKDQRILAENIRSYLDSMLKEGVDEDLLRNGGVENYVNQVWKRENPFGKAIVSDIAASKLQPNFKFARQRIFDSYFEGEQAGYKPSNKKIGPLIALYDNLFKKSLADRKFIKDLQSGTAKDGRPLVDVSGYGKVVADPSGKSSKVIIKPRINSEEMRDYRTIDHPALRGWKWLTNDSARNPVLHEGQLAVHPEIYNKLKNQLSKSRIRTYEIGGVRPGAALLDAQSFVKQSLLSFSGFHQAQEGVHALGHRVDPTGLVNKLEPIDFDHPQQKALIKGGLKVASHDAAQEFGEGLAGSGIYGKIPKVGRYLRQYQDYLFQDYIPALKMNMALHALERNTQRYAGKLSQEQIATLTADQANHAFGELNYKRMGRNPTLQDVFRVFLLAPDFLEARGGFVGQALRPHGREQLVALGLIAATQYITARVINQMANGDPHWEKKHAFSVIINGREYSLRTVPGDIMNFMTERQKFVFGRVSPIARVGIESVTGRDFRGVKRDTMQQVKDAASMALPISLAQRDDTRWWEQALNAMGVHEKQFSPVQDIQEKAADWKKKNLPKSAVEFTYDADLDAYRPLKLALEMGERDKARRAFSELSKTIDPEKIKKSIHAHYSRPFTGSKANESRFLNSLTSGERQAYNDAMAQRQRQQAVFDSFAP